MDRMADSVSGPARVLYISPQVGGGSIESLHQLISKLDRTRYVPSVLFARQPDNALLDRFSRAGASIVPSDSVAVSKRSGRRQQARSDARERLRSAVGDTVLNAYGQLRSVVDVMLKSVPESRRLARAIRQVRPDIVHVNSAPHSGLAAIMAAGIAGARCVCHVRNLSNPSRIQVWLSRSVSRFIFISTPVQEHLVRQGLGAENGIVIANGVDIDNFCSDSDRSALRQELGIDGTVFLAGIVGRLEHWKGHCVFLQAIARLREMGYPAHAVVVGSREEGVRNDAYFKCIEDTVHDKRLQSSVSFLGHRSDIARVMRGLDVSVLASTDPEPFGRVVIESMAAGTPVVASAAGGVLDILRDGHSGLLYSPGDDAALATAMARLIDEPALAASLRQAAYADVNQRFSSARTTDAVMRVYDQLIGMSEGQASAAA